MVAQRPSAPRDNKGTTASQKGKSPLGKIEKLVYGGEGLLRENGQAILVPFAAPGDDWQEGKLRESAAERIAPACPVFTRCGGCHYQHLPYPLQVEWKKEILRETLARLGHVDSPTIAARTGEPWRYRNRVQVHFNGRRLGFHAARSHSLVTVDRCPIASPAIERAMLALAEMAPSFLRTVELFSNEESTLVSVMDAAKPLRRSFFTELARAIPGADQSALDYPVGGDRFRVSYRAFFQVNRFLIEPLVSEAIAQADSMEAWDLYAGVGLMSIPLARRCERVTAVEVVSSAAHDLEMNAQRHGVRLNVVRGSTEDFLAAQTSAPRFVLADPPRAGLGKRVTDQLRRLRPARLTIVSCDPSTLARDLRALSDLYQLESLTLVDLFPQTFHIEAIARLISKSA